MKMIDIQGRLFHPAFIPDVPTGNLLWVDQVHGNDILAARERLTVPFQTLKAAKDAAQAGDTTHHGDTIVVMPGSYNENDLAKNGVNWHFLNGAIVDFDGSEEDCDPDLAIFDTSAIQGGAVFKVTGQGAFTTRDSATRGVVYLVQSGDDVSVAFATMKAEAEGVGVGVYMEAGKLSLTGDTLASTMVALYVTGSAQVQARVREIGSAAMGVSIGGSTTLVNLEAFRIHGESDNGLAFGIAAAAHIRAYEIKSDSSNAVVYNGNSPLHLDVARIVSAWNHSLGSAILVAAGTGGLFLYGCKLITHTAADHAITGPAGGTDVLALAPCSATKDKPLSVTFLVYPDLIVNAGIR